MAPKIKNALTTWLCAFVVMLSLGETRAEDFFAASHLESGQIAAANQGSISDFYDASQYDASGCTVAPVSGGTRQTTVLGENMMERVIPFADKTGARTLPFGTTSEKWAKLTPRQRWKLNDGALRARINEGDNFRYIGIDPGRPPALRNQFDLTRSELLRLNDRGVPFQTVSPKEVMSTIGRQ